MCTEQGPIALHFYHFLATVYTLYINRKLKIYKCSDLLHAFLFCELNISGTGYKVFMAVKMHIDFFWVMTLHGITEEHNASCHSAL
jgi:hypothetical protein